MNNPQNEQAPKTKRQHKPLFQKGTFLYKITYEFTDKVKAGKISFAKIFWIGLIINLILNIVVGTIFESNQMVVTFLGACYGAFYMQYLWHARKNVYHPAWFYIGFGLVSTMVAIILVSFGIRFS